MRVTVQLQFDDISHFATIELVVVDVRDSGCGDGEVLQPNVTARENKEDASSLPKMRIA